MIFDDTRMPGRSVCMAWPRHEQNPTKTEEKTETAAQPVVPGGPQNLTIDGISAIAVILIASFAIDRIVTGFLFLLSFNKRWARVISEPVRATKKDEADSDAGETAASRTLAEKRYKLVYYTLAFILGGVVLAVFGKVTIFRAIGFKEAPFLLDCVMTGLILVAGADRVAALLKSVGGASDLDRAGPQPIEITGKLTLEGEGGRTIVRTDAGDKVG